MVYILKQKPPRNRSKEKRKNRSKGSVRYVDLAVPTKNNSHCIQRKPLSAVEILRPE